jgi:hypothetical protein
VAVIAALLASNPASAAAPDQGTVAPATRVVSSDGTFAVTLPCKSKDVYVRQSGSVPLVACDVNAVFFGASRTAPKRMVDGKPVDGNFDSFLESVRANLGADRVRESSIAGHRAFEYLCPNSDGQPCKVVIEMPSGLPLMLTGGDSPAATASAAAWHWVSPSVATFFKSLEFLAK